MKNFHVSLSSGLIVTQYKFSSFFLIENSIERNVFIDNLGNQVRNTSHSDPGYCIVVQM